MGTTGRIAYRSRAAHLGIERDSPHAFMRSHLPHGGELGYNPRGGAIVGRLGRAECQVSTNWTIGLVASKDPARTSFPGGPV